MNKQPIISNNKINTKYGPFGILKDYVGNMPQALLIDGTIPPEMLEVLQENIPPELLGKSKKKKKY